MRSMLRCSQVGLLLALAAGGCARHRAPPRPTAEADASSIRDEKSAAEPVDSGLVLEGHPWQMDLYDVAEDGGVVKPKLGVVSVPLGARGPRPLLVALHGGSDRPEWSCGEWRGVTNAYPFLVCPRGAGGVEHALGWMNLADTKQRVARAVAAAKKIFGTWIRDDLPVVIVGFSMGGTQAALLAQSEPQRYRRVVLSESAYNPEPAMSFARAWAANGGERALFSCTTGGCEGNYRAAAKNVAAQHVPARLNIAGTQRHGIWDEVVRSLRRDWPWVVEGAPGWETYEPPVEEEPPPGRTEAFDAR